MKLNITTQEALISVLDTYDIKAFPILQNGIDFLLKIKLEKKFNTIEDSLNWLVESEGDYANKIILLASYYYHKLKLNAKIDFVYKDLDSYSNDELKVYLDELRKKLIKLLED